MPKQSAGILFYRHIGALIQVLLVHPGGPYWAKKDKGAWSIPKGEIEDGEERLVTARREVAEELGIIVTGSWLPLISIKQKSGKIVHARAVKQNIDEHTIKPNEIEIEWPPKSGMKKSIPEIDRAGWFTITEARGKIIEAQLPFLDEIAALSA